MNNNKTKQQQNNYHRTTNKQTNENPGKCARAEKKKKGTKGMIESDRMRFMNDNERKGKGWMDEEKKRKKIRD